MAKKSPATPKRRIIPGSAHAAAGNWRNGTEPRALFRQLREQRKNVEEERSAGFAQVLMRRGRVLHRACYGFADREAGTPFTDETLVRLFSMTKPVTVVGLMVLVEQKKIDLDAPVGKYLQCFRNVVVLHHANQVKSKEGDKTLAMGPSIRQLLIHTGGLSYGAGFGNEPRWACEKAYAELIHRVDSGELSSLAAFVEALAALPLRFEPKSRWEYSHGLDVIGRVIEVVSGRSLDSFLTEKVLGPLGMKDTSFSVSPAKAKRLATLYKPEQGGKSSLLRRLDGGIQSAWVRGRECRVIAGGGFMGSRFPTSDATSSVGGLVSTLRDYTRFVQMLELGGRCPGSDVRLLKESTVAAFFENWLTMDSVAAGGRRLKGWHDCGRGSMGWGPLGQVSLGESSRDIWMGGIAGTFWAIDRARELIIVHVAQVTETYDSFGEQLWDAARLAVAPPAKPAPPASSRRRKALAEEEEDKAPRKRARSSA